MLIAMVPRYATLADFLACQMLTIDASTDDGWGAPMSIKGREIEATILFADVTSFSARTANLGPAETLAFVNHFFAWTSAEALRHGPGIVDKYIGDEVMVVFSEEFGSEDPLLDAVHAARGMGQNDVYSFMPHVGIASGRVIVGYVGTPQGYSVSVFGAPVALAARCAGVALPDDLDHPTSSHITLPAVELEGRPFDDLIPTEIRQGPDREPYEEAHAWRLLKNRDVPMKNMGDVAVAQIVNAAVWLPSQSAEDRARELIRLAGHAGRRWVPRCERHANADGARPSGRLG
jgi:hypothetical protein